MGDLVLALVLRTENKNFTKKQKSKLIIILETIYNDL